jgi:hypothetical protein
MIPSSTMHFLENDHVILITRGDATQECANAFIA